MKLSKHITVDCIYNLLKLLIEDDNLLITMKKNSIKTALEFLSYGKISEITIN